MRTRGIVNVGGTQVGWGAQTSLMRSRIPKEVVRQAAVASHLKKQRVDAKEMERPRAEAGFSVLRRALRGAQ